MYLVKKVCFVEEGDRALDGVKNFFWGNIYKTIEKTVVS